MKSADSRVAEADAAHDLVMDAIVTQRLAPSQKVSESILQEMFGISRTTSRNLMERLTAQQFLVNVSPRITRVAPLTLREIRQNFALRKMLVPEMCAMSASQQNIEELNRYKSRIEELLPVQNDEQALEALRANKLLNLALCDTVEFPLMKYWHHQLENTAMRIYWFYVKTNKAFPYRMQQQADIIDLMRSDDRERIRRIIFDSLSQTEDRVFNAIYTNDQFLSQNLKV